MKHPPEIIAARINFETARLNATIAEMSSENSGRLSDGSALAWSGEMFAEARAEHEAAVAAILAELELTNPDAVTISRQAARISLAAYDRAADYREKHPTPSKAKLWRRMASLYGRVLLLDGPKVLVNSQFSELCTGENEVQQFIWQWERVKLRKRERRAIAKLKAAYEAWEVAEYPGEVKEAVR